MSASDVGLEQRPSIEEALVPEERGLLTLVFVISVAAGIICLAITVRLPPEWLALRIMLTALGYFLELPILQLFFRVYQSVVPAIFVPKPDVSDSELEASP
jgi:hypothetical protein